MQDLLSRMENQQALGKQIRALRSHKESGQPGEASAETPATAPATPEERGLAGGPTTGGTAIGVAVMSQGPGGEEDSALTLGRSREWTGGCTAAGEPSLLGGGGGGGAGVEWVTGQGRRDEKTGRNSGLAGGSEESGVARPWMGGRACSGKDHHHPREGQPPREGEAGPKRRRERGDTTGNQEGCHRRRPRDAGHQAPAPGGTPAGEDAPRTQE